ncbi:P-II family nitrogen regulator [Methanomethylophilus alvi]|uniref:P-II family nitrogen regulator n=1 Tax=Methanomethylophilus alvi TaxID=1291540 RepID=UPI0037DC1B2C
MKMVVAIVRPEKYGEVKDALKDRGVTGMTFTHVTGRGMQAGVKFTNRVGEFMIDEIEKVKIEIVVEDDSKVPCVIDTICQVAKTGRHGDGRIFVLPVESAVRISEWEPEPVKEAQNTEGN